MQGSAGYVALERITGTLRTAGPPFRLSTATMDRRTASLSCTVVPDSGTGDLAGLAGKLDIKVADGKHFYEFDYTLGESG